MSYRRCDIYHTHCTCRREIPVPPKKGALKSLSFSFLLNFFFAPGEKNEAGGP